MRLRRAAPGSISIPTNDVVPSDRHIAIAHGRDFGDVTPMRGVILGGGRHELRVGVDVEPISSGA